MSALGSETRQLTRLAIPVVVTQVGSMLMTMVDVLMVGRVGVDALGAVSLGRVWTFGTLLFAIGLLLGNDPILTQAQGSRNQRMLGLAFQRGIVLAALASLPVAGLWLVTRVVLGWVGQDPELTAMAHRYVLVQLPSILPFLLFGVFRQYLQARAIMRPAMYVVLGANLINVLFNWMFIYGHLGIPAMGVVGAGIATALSRSSMALALGVFLIRGKLLEGGWIPWSREAFRVQGLVDIAKLGIPVALHVGLEVWAFQLATLLAGRISTLSLGAHTVAINLASFSFMFPLGVSQAAVTRVGNLIGEGRSRRAQVSAWAAMVLGCGIMSVFAIVFILFRHQLPRLYSTEGDLIVLAASILPIASAFQIFDGIQVVGTGILRGMGRTRPAAWINLFGYYGLALPIAWWLGFHRGGGVAGIWWGLCIGLGLIAVLFLTYLYKWGPATSRSILDVTPREAPVDP